MDKPAQTTESNKNNNVLPLPNGADALKEQLKSELDLAAQLLLPNPAELGSRGQQLSIPVVKTPGALEYIRTHPTLRLTLNMVVPNKEAIGATAYGVLPHMEAVLRRHKFEPFPVTLFPIVVDSTPPIYKLVMIKIPVGRKWDNWNLSKKLCLEKAVNDWVAIRPVQGGYHACDPDPEVEFPEPEFLDWTANEWLERSLGAADEIIKDETHHIFDAIRGRR